MSDRDLDAYYRGMILQCDTLSKLSTVSCRVLDCVSVACLVCVSRLRLIVVRSLLHLLRLRRLDGLDFFISV